MIRFALLGCGRVSSRYLEVFSDGVDGAELTACCDINRAKADEAASRAGLKAAAFDDFAEMIAKARPDVVCVLTESGRHYEHALKVLAAGCHAVVEKPVTLIPQQAYDLSNKAREKGLMLTVVKQNRWNPAMGKLMETVRSGRFGRIITATIRLRWCRRQEYYDDGWHGTWAMDGGVINQQAIHHIDAVNWLCGPIDKVCAHGSRRLMNLEAEDTAVAVLQFADGALGTIEATTAARPRDVEASLSIIGENGMAVVSGIALNEIQTWEFSSELPEDKDVHARFSEVVPNGYGLGHGPYLQAVADRLAANDSTPVLSAEEGVKAVEIVHALYASMERKAWVDMAERPLSAHLGRAPADIPVSATIFPPSPPAILDEQRENRKTLVVLRRVKEGDILCRDNIGAAPGGAGVGSSMLEAFCGRVAAHDMAAGSALDFGSVL